MDKKINPDEYAITDTVTARSLATSTDNAHDAIKKIIGHITVLKSYACAHELNSEIRLTLAQISIYDTQLKIRLARKQLIGERNKTILNDQLEKLKADIILLNIENTGLAAGVTAADDTTEADDAADDAALADDAADDAASADDTTAVDDDTKSLTKDLKKIKKELTDIKIKVKALSTSITEARTTIQLNKQTINTQETMLKQLTEQNETLIVHISTKTKEAAKQREDLPKKTREQTQKEDAAEEMQRLIQFTDDVFSILSTKNQTITNKISDSGKKIHFLNLCCSLAGPTPSPDDEANSRSLGKMCKAELEEGRLDIEDQEACHAATLAIQ